MKETMVRAGRMIRSSWKTLLLFEMFFRVYTSFGVFSLCRLAYNVCLRWTGINCLTTDTAVRFFKSPVMLACCLFMFLAFTLNMMLEISCIVTILHAGRNDRTLSILQILKAGLFDTWRLLRPRNWTMLLLIALMMPFTQVAVSGSLLRVAHLSGQTLLQYATAAPYCYGVALYAAAILVLFLMAMCAIPVYVLEDLPTRESFRTAAGLNRGHRVRSLLTVLVPVVLMSLVSVQLASWLKSLIGIVFSWISGNETLKYNFMLAMTTLFGFLSAAIPTTAGYALLTSVYIQGKHRAGQPLPEFSYPVKPNARRQNAIAFYIMAGACVLALILYDTVLRPLMVRYDVVSYVDPGYTMAIAHRGDASVYDENTLSAIRSSIAMGADYVEIDVQLTSDGVVVVQHDKNYRRVFGDARSVWKTAYDEVLLLHGRKTGEGPSTLYDVLMQCEPQANFLIELKDTGHNIGLAEATYNVLEQAGALDRCTIQSSSYAMLCEFKHLAPEVKTGYILSLSVGNYVRLQYVDFYSIDLSFVNRDVVNAIHEAGKQVLCWTVDSRSNMQRMLELNVDGIITNDIPLLKTVLLENSATPLDEIIAEPIEELIAPEEEAPAVEETVEPEATPGPGEETVS